MQSLDVIIEQRYHSQLIGAKGANIKEIIEKFGGISINFPDSGKTSDILTFVSSRFFFVRLTSLISTVSAVTRRTWMLARSF